MVKTTHSGPHISSKGQLEAQKQGSPLHVAEKEIKPTTIQACYHDLTTILVVGTPSRPQICHISL